MVELITRARARLDHDLGRVLVLQGESPDLVSSGLGYGHHGHGIGSGLGGGGGSFSLGGRNPVGQINESLRNAFAGSAGLGSVLGLGAGDVLPLSPLAQAAAAAAANAANASSDAHRHKSTLLLFSSSL